MPHSEEIVGLIAEVRAQEAAFLQAGRASISAAGGALFASHFFVIGTIKKAVSVLSGFASLVENENFTCAAALVRLHVDTVARFSALGIVNDPEAFSMEVLGGARIDHLKDRQGNRLSDQHLVKKLGKSIPWLLSVYRATSGFVHLSERHIFASLRSTDGETREVQMFIGANDSHVPERYYREMLEAFVALCELLLELLRQWTASLSDRAMPNES